MVKVTPKCFGVQRERFENRQNGNEEVNPRPNASVRQHYLLRTFAPRAERYDGERTNTCTSFDASSV